MSGRDPAQLRQAAIAKLAEAGRAAADAGDAEAAVRCITGAIYDLLGDREAHLRPGALKPGERQFFVAGVFLVKPDRDGHLLFAEHGFPPEQHRLEIAIDLALPGWVYANRTSLLLANTDDDTNFRQILKTSRMGSVLFGPMFWRGEMIGQLIMAAQARHTFGQPDLDVLNAFAHLAAAVFVAHDGPAFLRSIAADGKRQGAIG